MDLLESSLLSANNNKALNTSYITGDSVWPYMCPDFILLLKAFFGMAVQMKEFVMLTEYIFLLVYVRTLDGIDGITKLCFVIQFVMI